MNIKKIMPFFIKLFGGAFALLVTALVIDLSFSALGRIFEDDFYMQLLGVVVFDIAALIWFYRMVDNAETKAQYGTAFLGFLVGIGGVIMLVITETRVNAGVLTDTAQAMRTLSDSFIVATIGHLLLGYFYKASDMATTKRFAAGMAKAEYFEDAMRQSDAAIEQSRAALGKVLHGEFMRELLNDMHIVASEEQLNDLFGDSVVVAEKTENTGFIQSMKNALGLGKKQQPESVASETETEKGENAPGASFQGEQAPEGKV